MPNPPSHPTLQLENPLRELDASLPQFDLFSIGGTTVSVATLVVIALVVLLTIALSWVLRRAIGKAANFRGVGQEGTVAVFQRLVHYGVLASGLAIALDTIGLNISALFAAGAMFAVGVGFAMRNIAENFVSGLILLGERSIKPGDILEVEGQFVRVERMGIRATIAHTRDSENIIIPNSTLVQSAVKNFTLRDSVYRVRVPVGVTYGSDMALVRRTLESVAVQLPKRIATKDPLILMTEFGDSAVLFEVSVWVDDPWRTRRTRSELHEAIWWAFRDKDVTIAFPQLDVHLDSEVGDWLGAGRNGEREGETEGS